MCIRDSYHLALEAYLKEKGYPYKSLVAFSGTVKDGGKNYTEANIDVYKRQVLSP